MARERKLTPAEIATAEPAILARMQAAPTFTYRDLINAGDAAVGWAACYRLADRLIQRERLGGRIRQTATRGVWTLSEPQPA